jgi:hypothetical protein
MNCPHCQQILPDNYSAGYCPFCGDDFPKDFHIEQTAVRQPEPKPIKKWKWWLAFWIVFLGSSFFACASIFMEDLVVPCLSVGWLICSFLSVRIFRGKLRLQIILPLLLLAVFLALGWFLPVAGFFVGIFIFGFKT